MHRRLGRVAAVLLSLGALALLVRSAVSGWRSLGDVVSRPDWGAAAGLLVCATFAMVWIAAQWNAVLRALGHSIGNPRGVALYFLGEIGKYVPGGLWPVVGRAELALRDRNVEPRPGAGLSAPLTRPTAYASVLLSLAYLFLGGLVGAGVSGSAAIADHSGSRAPLLLLLLLPLGLAALHPRVANPAIASMMRLLRRPQRSAPKFPAWATSLGLVLRYVPAWVAIAAATVFANQMVGGHAGVAVLGAAACLAWVAGFLVVPAPGGLGAREAVFAATLGSSVPAGQAAAVALVARLAFVVVDGVGAVAAGVWLSAERRRASRESTPTPT